MVSVIDGSNYSNLLQSHQKEDEQQIESFLKIQR